MITFFRTYLNDLFHPEINHYYSGRNNDNKFSLTELFYQIYIYFL